MNINQVSMLLKKELVLILILMSLIMIHSQIWMRTPKLENNRHIFIKILIPLRKLNLLLRILDNKWEYWHLHIHLPSIIILHTYLHPNIILMPLKTYKEIQIKFYIGQFKLEYQIWHLTILQIWNLKVDLSSKKVTTWI